VLKDTAVQLECNIAGLSQDAAFVWKNADHDDLHAVSLAFSSSCLSVTHSYPEIVVTKNAVLLHLRFKIALY